MLNNKLFFIKIFLSLSLQSRLIPRCSNLFFKGKLRTKYFQFGIRKHQIKKNVPVYFSYIKLSITLIIAFSTNYNVSKFPFRQNLEMCFFLAFSAISWVMGTWIYDYRGAFIPGRQRCLKGIGNLCKWVILRT